MFGGLTRETCGNNYKQTRAQAMKPKPGFPFAGKPAFCQAINLGDVSVKAETITGVDTRPVIAFSFLVLGALAAVSGAADARSCGMMKPPVYMGIPPQSMKRPMHHPMPYPMNREMRHGGGYASTVKFGPSVIAVAKQIGVFDTLLSAVDEAELTGLLEGDGPFTLFAPTDAAFEKLPEGALEELLADKKKLTALLKYHLVPARVTAAKVVSSRTLKTASEQELPTTDLSVTRADIRARNGIIHIVDKVLLPAG